MEKCRFRQISIMHSLRHGSVDCQSLNSWLVRGMGTTYEQTLKYEVARDLLNGRRAELSERIALEEAKPTSDAAVIAQLLDSMGAVAVEINRLDVTDEAMLDAVIRSNRRN